jgi:hypothetical protein
MPYGMLADFNSSFYDSKKLQLFNPSTLQFFSFFVVFNLHTSGDGEGYQAECHHHPEEVLIADVAGDEA